MGGALDFTATGFRVETPIGVVVIAEEAILVPWDNPSGIMLVMKAFSSKGREWQSE